MRCYYINNKEIELTQRHIPIVKSGEVLIQVKAVGVNRADLLHIEGRYISDDGYDVPGIEFAGINTKNGDRVCGLVASGAYAEYIAVDEKNIIKLPDELGFIEAAALPEALSVAWLNLYALGGVQSASAVLIHGASSGIGHILTQIAMHNCKTVYATARTLEKIQMFKGKCDIISFSDKFEDLIGERQKADLVIDILGGKYLNQNIKCCAPNAKIIMLASMDNRFAEIDLGSVLMKNITIIGSTLRSKTVLQKERILQNVKEYLLPLVMSKHISPIISKVFHFDELKAAHYHLRSGLAIGKIVIEL